MTPAPNAELDSHFQYELQFVHADLRRKAALAAFAKLRPGNRITVEQFLTQLERHKDLWAAVSTLGMVDFAEAIAGHRIPSTVETARPRTRINDEQKNSLKRAILRVLAGHPAGLNRTELTAALLGSGLAPAGIDPTELSEKLR